MSKAFINESVRSTPVIAKAAVVVVGGGPAGFAAALAARKQGAKTLILEKNGFLGGILTSVTLGNICGIYTLDKDGTLITVVQGIASSLIQNLTENNYATPPRRRPKTATVAFDVTGMKLIMDDMMVKSGAAILFNVVVVGVVKESGRIRGLFVEGKGGRGFIEGDVFIDATGDGDIFAKLD